MKSTVLFGVMLGVVLFAASPALATIMGFLETPEDMQNVSGITLERGWGFSTLGGPVTVTQRVNGADTSNALPCCSPRADVQAAVSGAPLNTGFSTQINYGVFDPAMLNSLGIRITAPNEQDVIIDHQVMAAKPGNAEFLNNFILGPTANIASDGNEIVIGGAQVMAKGGGTTQTNLRIEYEINSQSPVITEAFDGPNATLFNPVQTIFTNRCAVTGCHDSSTHQNGQDLSAGNAWKNIVAVRAMEDPSARPRVSPGEDDNSYLYQKVIANGTRTGARMPFGCSGNSCLSDPEIMAIEDWINDGARPPQ